MNPDRHSRILATNSSFCSDAMKWLGENSSIKNTRYCSRSVIQNGTTSSADLVINPSTGKTHFRGIQTCDNPWSCPRCSRARFSTVRDDLTTRLEKWRSVGGKAVFLTLTIRHQQTSVIDYSPVGEFTLEKLFSVVTDTWRQVQQDKSVRALKELVGLVGWDVRKEITYGHGKDGNGWHVHIHALGYLDTRDLGEDIKAYSQVSDPMVDLENHIRQTWHRYLKATPYEPSQAHGCRLDVIDLTNVSNAVAEYMASSLPDSIVAQNVKKNPYHDPPEYITNAGLERPMRKYHRSLDQQKTFATYAKVNKLSAREQSELDVICQNMIEAQEEIRETRESNIHMFERQNAVLGDWRISGISPCDGSEEQLCQIQDWINKYKNLLDGEEGIYKSTPFKLAREISDNRGMKHAAGGNITIWEILANAMEENMSCIRILERSRGFSYRKLTWDQKSRVRKEVFGGPMSDVMRDAQNLPRVKSRENSWQMIWKEWEAATSGQRTIIFSRKVTALMDGINDPRKFWLIAKLEWVIDKYYDISPLERQAVIINVGSELELLEYPNLADAFKKLGEVFLNEPERVIRKKLRLLLSEMEQLGFEAADQNITYILLKLNDGELSSLWAASWSTLDLQAFAEEKFSHSLSTGMDNEAALDLTRKACESLLVTLGIRSADDLTEAEEAQWNKYVSTV